jgi:hypothetical protein
VIGHNAECHAFSRQDFQYCNEGTVSGCEQHRPWYSPVVQRAGAFTISVTDGYYWWNDDESRMRFQIPVSVVNIAHFKKLK